MKLYTYAFEKLEVWKLAKELVKVIYQETAAFPTEEKFGLVSQMRRASISVASNLAEGSVRSTSKDRTHFANLSYSSLMEVLNHAILAHEIDFLNQEGYLLIRERVQELSYKINRYIQSLEK